MYKSSTADSYERLLKKTSRMIQSIISLYDTPPQPTEQKLSASSSSSLSSSLSSSSSSSTTTPTNTDRVYYNLRVDDLVAKGIDHHCDWNILPYVLQSCRQSLRSLVLPITIRNNTSAYTNPINISTISRWWATNWCRRRDYLDCGALYVLTLMLIAKRNWMNSLEGYDNILTLYYVMILSVTWYRRSSNSHKYWKWRYHHFSMISVLYCAALIVAYALLALHELHEELLALHWENFLWSSPIIRQRMILINTTRAKRTLLSWVWECIGSEAIR